MITSIRPDAKPPIVRSPVVDTTSAPLLRAYLAGRDAPCPACGYNLRGNANGHCPECGEALTLHLRPTGPLARRSGLILLVFLWLLAASAFQGYTAVRSLHAAATNPWQRFLNINLSSSLTLPSASMQRNVGGVITLVPTPSVATAPAPAGGRTQWSATWPQFQTLGATGGYNWSAISWRQWTQAGAWTILAIGAVVGLVLLILLHRRREASPRLGLATAILAWTGFGGFCAMHLASTVLGLL